MKILTLLLLIGSLLSFRLVGQTAPDHARHPEPPYQLAAPTGWQLERFPIPIDFAPQIPYKGLEDIRFAPDWGQAGSAGYWSYTFVWWIEGKPKIDADQLQQYLKAYYSGLVNRNSAPGSTPGETTARIAKAKPTPAGEVQYRGTVQMLDYMAKKPITLTCHILVKPCNEQGHTALFFALSPQPTDHPIWKQLETIRNSFQCKKD